MHTGNSIIMHAPRMAIFETAANLELWPKILPHYRYIRYLERGDDHLFDQLWRFFRAPIGHELADACVKGRIDR